MTRSRDSTEQELERLRQENARLQEKNVELSKQLQSKTTELIQERNKSQLFVNREILRNGESLSSDLPLNLPGDSFPAVAPSLDMVTMSGDEDETEGRENENLYSKLIKAGRRMEQIKRQLIAQRGSIVAALKLLAESRSSNGSLSNNSNSMEKNSLHIEQDRTLTSYHMLNKVCPMCEARFSLDVPSEEFEHHVFQHFSYESDTDTLQYFSSEEAL